MLKFNSNHQFRSSGVKPTGPLKTDALFLGQCKRLGMRFAYIEINVIYYTSDDVRDNLSAHLKKNKNISKTKQDIKKVKTP